MCPIPPIPARDHATTLSFDCAYPQLALLGHLARDAGNVVRVLQARQCRRHPEPVEEVGVVKSLRLQDLGNSRWNEVIADRGDEQTLGRMQGIPNDSEDIHWQCPT